jgi:hypothetical protein
MSNHLSGGIFGRQSLREPPFKKKICLREALGKRTRTNFQVVDFTHYYPEEAKNSGLR